MYNMNMNQMMKQDKTMQEQMLKAQEELENKTVEGSAGGGAVTVTANGRKRLLSVAIKPEAVDPEDVEMLQDLVLAAVNDALDKVDEMVNQDMSRFMGNMKIPGLFCRPGEGELRALLDPQPSAKHIEAFSRLPGIGPKRATRLAFHVL